MIFLIGFMGCGKTTMGQRMASRMRLRFYDIDALIEASQDMSIAGIMDRHGESFFRDLEMRVLKNMPEDGVCATGGGIVLRAENRELLKNPKHRTILIDPPWEILWERIKSSHRPLIKGRTESEVMKLWQERQPLYHECAGMTLISPGND